MLRILITSEQRQSEQAQYPIALLKALEFDLLYVMARLCIVLLQFVGLNICRSQSPLRFIILCLHIPFKLQFQFSCFIINYNYLLRSVDDKLGFVNDVQQF